jgi:hypothetical protein
MVSSLVLSMAVAGCTTSTTDSDTSPVVNPTHQTEADTNPAEPEAGLASSDAGNAASDAGPATSDANPSSVASVELLGHVTFSTGTMFENTEVGGLSGITYDPQKDVYYVLSDDRGSVNPARFYLVDIDLSDGSLEDGDVALIGVTTLKDADGSPFAPGSIDPEAIEFVAPDQLYVSSEGVAGSRPVIDPFVRGFAPTGKETSVLPVPEKFLPDGAETTGIGDNKAFESLTSTPDKLFLYTATENALLQDGPLSSLTESSPSRLLEFNLENQTPGREFIYLVEPIPQVDGAQQDSSGAAADNGLVDLQAIDNRGVFLAMERSYTPGVGNTVKIFETSIDGATDVSGRHSLDPGDGTQVVYEPMTKRSVVDIAALGIQPDNLEAMSFGPLLPDGRMLLILVSDNNFNPNQTTQFIALAVELEPA